MSKPKSFVCPKDHGLLRKTTIGDVLGVGSGIAHVCGSCDGVWIEDVGSTNGTYVNGVRLSKARKLAAGDLVRVGETDLRFEA